MTGGGQVQGLLDGLQGTKHKMLSMQYVVDELFGGSPQNRSSTSPMPATLVSPRATASLAGTGDQTVQDMLSMTEGIGADIDSDGLVTTSELHAYIRQVEPIALADAKLTQMGDGDLAERGTDWAPPRRPRGRRGAGPRHHDRRHCTGSRKTNRS